ncbi:MAG: two component transcriptional regulator, LytTR family [Ferruginibacter sp.]|nr:two component transcriptional regulator, LytTR family [Ferruginibacter sp.]
MITCIAIDDEPLALQVIKKYAAQTPDLKLLATYSDAIEAMNFLQHNPVNLVLLDISMPDINGFQLYKNLAVKPMVIFTTAHREYALDGFEADAIDYLLKPFNLLRFQKAVGKAVAWERFKKPDESKTPSPYLYIHEDYKVVRIAYDEIIFIEALDDYVKIHTDTKFYLTLLSMKKVMEKLPAKQFIRIHRSYIVCREKITFSQFRKLGLINNIELPIGDTYRSYIPNI